MGLVKKAAIWFHHAMKIPSALILGLLGVSQLLAGDPIQLPKDIRLLTQLEQVKQEAADQNKGISFMLMDPGST